MTKLLASDIIEIDEKFINDISEKVKNNISPTKKKLNTGYTVSQIAEHTSKTKNTIRRHIENGLLQANKIGKSWYVSQEQLDQYLNKNGNDKK